ncbi:MAG: PTS mannose transporter subunit IIA [Actinobacteria bacterium]|nr:PTS mannose transporter subunit IIA [Actinomycetota bacterium]
MSSVAATSASPGGGVRAAIQRFGGNLAAMIMPNIGAFIAWGLITALFIPTGWIPNENLAELVGPMILTLLPLLIGYTGGRLVHGQRGAVAGAVATMGIIVATEIPMFLGAMLIGPPTALLVRWFDRLVEGRVRSGFEMLVGNFSLGILSGAMAIVGYLAIGPIVEAITNALGDGVEILVDNRLLPIASIVIEPAKVLFMNNAINHGVLGPIGVAEAKEAGQSILFMLETNPGPGLGILLAFWVAGPRAVRPTVPGAAIIHFLGGIHEIYFPYVLMKPQMILAAIAGGAAGVMTFLVTGAGLVATPSPGSIFAYLAVTPRGGHFGVLLGILIAAGVSFVTGVGILRMSKEAPVEAEETAPASGPMTTAPQGA